MATADPWIYHHVTSLLACSLEQVLPTIPYNMDIIRTLPGNLKEKLLNLMTKRSIANDSNLAAVLHKQLRTIDLTECNISDQTLSNIALMCPQLCKIDLNSTKDSRTEITDEGVLAIAMHCRRLQIIYLRRCLQVTDHSVVTLAQHCPLLRDLNIGGCTRITDDSLRALGENSSSLRSINFSHANVTDNGVFALTNGVCSNTLKEIYMNCCENLTDESVEAVVQLCLNVNILIFHSCPKITEKSREALELLAERDNVIKHVTWTIY